MTQPLRATRGRWPSGNLRGTGRVPALKMGRCPASQASAAASRLTGARNVEIVRQVIVFVQGFSKTLGAMMPLPLIGHLATTFLLETKRPAADRGAWNRG